MGHIKIDMVRSLLLHLGVNGTCHNISWGERHTRVILLHKLLTVEIAEHCSISSHSLSDEERGAIAGMIEGGGMELDEFHILHSALGTIHHRNTIARGDKRIGGSGVDGTNASRCHHGDTGQEGLHSSCLLIKHICTVAGYVGSATRHDSAQMMLGDYLYGKMMLEDINIGIGPHSLHETRLDFSPRIVSMVENTEFRVSALAMQIEGAVILLVEIYTPAYEFTNLFRGMGDYFGDGLTIAKPVTGYHGILYMLFKIIHLKVGDARHTSLSKVCVGLLKGGLADKGHSPLLRHLEGEAHSGDAGTNHQIIIFMSHVQIFFESCYPQIFVACNVNYGAAHTYGLAPKITKFFSYRIINTHFPTFTACNWAAFIIFATSFTNLAETIMEENTSGIRKKPAKGGMHYGFVIVACCCLIMGVNVGLSFSCAGIFYQPVSEAIGVSVGKFGLYMSIMYVASSLMLPIAGKMIERMSARLLFTGSCALMGLTYLAMAFFTNVWEFYASGAVMGCTLAFLLYLSFPTLVNRWFRTKVGLLIGVCSAASGIGGMIFNPIAAWIITEWSWRVAYGCFAALLILVVTPLLYIFLRDWPSDKGLTPYGELEALEGKVKKGDDGIEYSKAVKMPVFYSLWVFAFLMMGISTLNLFIPKYATSLEFTLEQASWAASAAMFGVMLGKLVLGYINDRNCSLGVLVTTLSGALGLLVMIFGAHTLALICCGAFLFGWAYAGVTVQTTMLTRKVFGNRSYARINAMVSIGLAAGGAVASGGWGLLADWTSITFIFYIGAALLVLCAMIGLADLAAAKRLESEAIDK